MKESNPHHNGSDRNDEVKKDTNATTAIVTGHRCMALNAKEQLSFPNWPAPVRETAQ